MNTKRLKNKHLLLASLIILLGFGSLALTKSNLFQQIAKSQRLINNVYKYLITNYVDDIDIETFTRRSVRNIVSEMDPYTVYLEAEERDGIELLTSGSYGGVGIQIGEREGRLTVIAPMDDSPAQRAGIISGDVIIKIDATSTDNMNLDEAAKKIRGDKGTNVILTIERFGEDDVLEYTLTRAAIHVKDVIYSGKLNDYIGYIRLTRFSKNAVPEMKQALDKLMIEDVESIILDLRDNPGGLLNSAIEILDMFIPKGEPLLSTKGRTKESNRTYTAKKTPSVPERIKLAILVNGGSASASEIVAGTVQDLDRGVVIGKRSFGKGLVQTVYGLDDKRSLKITTAKYYIPSGRLIQKPGYINTDIVLSDGLSDSLFTTVGGRVVKGGGGITPDYQIEGTKAPLLTRECWRRGVFFTYAQKRKHEYASIQEVQQDLTLMDEFEKYLQEIDLDVSISGEKQYQETKQKLTALDSTDMKLVSAFDLIDTFINEQETSLFGNEYDRIEQGLLSEFANIYDGTVGRFKISLANDEVVKAAIYLLQDQMAYNEIFFVKN